MVSNAPLSFGSQHLSIDEKEAIDFQRIANATETARWGSANVRKYEA